MNTSIVLVPIVVGLLAAGRGQRPSTQRADGAVLAQVAYSDAELALVRSGGRIGFVKLVRETHGLTLRQAATAYDVLSARP